jgi:membrane associated rhomboid family serine protease
MGLYDRDYTREDDDWRSGQPGRGAPLVQSMTIALIVINAAVFLVDQLFGDEHKLMLALSVKPDTIVQPWLWWQFLTAAFAHDWHGINHIFGNMLGLFFFGKAVEAKIGRGEFLRFYLLVAVLANVVAVSWRYLLVPENQWGPLLGASGAVTAVIIAFICYFPRATVLLFFVLPMPAWALGIFLIGGDVLGSLRTPVPGEPRTAHDVHLVGAAFAAAYWYFHWHLSTIMPTAWLGNVKGWLRKPKLKIHDPEPTYENLDAEADRVLAKINEHGEASLTPAERRVLEDYSRRMRQKLR